MVKAIGRLSAASTLLLAAATTLIRVVLVPRWWRADPAEFKAWFVKAAPTLRAVMVPLGATATAMAATNALVTREARPLLGAAGAAGLAAVTMTINEPMNAKFEGPDPVERADLDRWVRWHNLRVVLGLVAAWGATARRSN
jgi:hypothetical protein